MTPDLHQVQHQIVQALAKHPNSRVRIDVRVTAKEKADWTKLAHELDTNLSALVRATLTQLAQQHKK
ncbi:hypothetical protein [Microseira sp. BLCC-F43]|jgi:hypothetical protein|uniref:hypothetical protein n=1 Tax=Microseira sp. BLCC-F43 TaxID=3153602 RepID=UPI0035B86B8F